MAKGLASCGGTYRAQRAVLHVVHRQLHLRVLADAGVLEKGHAAEVGGVTAALRTNQNTAGVSKEPGHWCTHQLCGGHGTSTTSVWPCLVQKTWGGVVQLTDTKLLGFRSNEGVERLVQAGKDRAEVT